MTPKSTSVNIEHLFEISKIVAEAPEWKPALDQIVQLVHSILIFDNLVVYLSATNHGDLEAVYAKALGRGRSAEADISWGENLIRQVFSSKKTIIEEPEVIPGANRLEYPFILGIPLMTKTHPLGVLTLIRFGGPTYTPENVRLAEFIAQQISLLIEHHNLLNEYKALEARHLEARLQHDFISSVSHELRRPLGFIKGYTTSLLRTDTAWDEATQQEFLNIIDQETDDLTELIDNLLDSSRLQSGQLAMNVQLVRLDALLNEIITRAHLHHPDLKIQLETAQALTPISGDPRRLSQVLENLISNALKYAPGSPVLVKILQDETDVYIRVEDRGPGISEEFLPYIFDRFYRIPEQSSSVHGTGLGLYICKQIICAHNGKISVESKLGTGTTFLIKLPLKS